LARIAALLNARPIAKSELAAKVTEALEDKKEKIVLIKATRRQLRHGDGSDGRTAAAGIEDVGLITDPKTSSGGAAGGRNGSRHITSARPRRHRRKRRTPVRT
jgi:hypothetical protein